MRKTLVLSLAGAAALGAGGAAFAQADRPALSRADVEERTSQEFARLDTNGDGKLDSADREAHLETRRKAAFDQLDQNGDGQISFAEFTTQGEARRERFAGIREDGGERLRPALPRFGGRPLLRDADADGDGVISEAEFAGAALARFDRADTDKDGTISPAEHRTLRFERRRPPVPGGAG